MDVVISQLKKDFNNKIRSVSSTLPAAKSTLALLTEEELKELENVWVELAVWKKSHTH